jgi:Uma2 family endonuclease
MNTKQQLLEEWCELPLKIQLYPAIVLTDEQFFELCQINRDLQIERSAKGELVFMSPRGSEGDRVFSRF